jgi:hypothetical protein
VRRLHARPVIAAEPGPHLETQTPANPNLDCLELPAQPRLSVHGG